MGVLAVTELVRPVVAHLLETAVADRDEHKVETSLREIADGAGLSMLDAHRAVQELLDLKLLRLDQDLLWIPDREALTRHPDEPVAA